MVTTTAVSETVTGDANELFISISIFVSYASTKSAELVPLMFVVVSAIFVVLFYCASSACLFVFVF